MTNVEHAQPPACAAGSPYEPIDCVYDSLARLAAYRANPQEQLDQLLSRIEACRANLERWAAGASAGCRHLYDLVEAERLRTLGDRWAAVEAYDRAIDAAKSGGYAREEALANELAAMFFLDLGKPKIARVYMEEAHRCYGRCGGLAQQRDFERRHGQWFAPPAQAGADERDGATAGWHSQAPGSVAQAPPAISGRFSLDDLPRESHDLLYAIIAAAPAAIFGLDLDGNVQLIWNGAAERMLGWSAQEALGQFLPIMPPDKIAEFAQLRAWLQSGRSLEGMEVRRLRRDGTPIDCSVYASPLYGADGAISGSIAVLLDITERKRAEVELRKFQYSIDQALISVFWIARDGRFLYVNEQACQSLGYTRAELLELRLSDIDPNYTSRDLARDWPAIQSRHIDVRAALETIHRRKDGTTFPVEVSARHVQFEDQEMLVSFTRDITERKRAETELLQLNDDLERRVADRTWQLEAANRELEAFAYSVSHDLRAPLRAIDGYTQILAEDYQAALDAEGRRVCSVIQEETQRMGRLIDDLLGFSRVGRAALRIAPIDMNALAGAVFEELCPPDARARVRLRVARLPAAMGDPTLIRQVWVNLLSNALKFSAKRALTTIEILGHENGTELIYTVRDNGAGFDMRYAEKLFGVFQRLHSEREFPGTGVGLAIVQRVIQRHGGRVWASGVVDGGATMSFALPCGQASEVSAGAVPYECPCEA